VECTTRRAGQSELDDESSESAVVLPRLAGDARLLRSLDRRRRYADSHHLWPHDYPLYRYQPARVRLLHLEAAQVCYQHISLRFRHLVGLHDCHRHVHPRSRLAMVLARANLGSQSSDLRSQPRSAGSFRHHFELGERHLWRGRRWRILRRVRTYRSLALLAPQSEKLSTHEHPAIFAHNVLLAHNACPADKNVFLSLSTLPLPIKMFIRLLFHIKYVWITPWFNV